MLHIYVTPKRKLYSFWIDPETAARLKRLKARVGISEADQIRSAIQTWLDRQERRIVARKRREAEKPKQSA